MGNLSNDFRSRIMLYLDNELSKQEERELLMEMRQNPECKALLSQEKSFREFIRNKVNRRKVSPTLISSIKDKIRADH